MSKIVVRISDNLVMDFGDNPSEMAGCTIIEYPIFPELVAGEWTFSDNRFMRIPEIQAQLDAVKAANAIVLDNIASLEEQVTNRRLREAVLGDNGWLEDINAQISNLRNKLL